MKKNNVFLLIVLFFSGSVFGADLATKIFSGQEKKLILTAQEERKDELKTLREAKEALEKERQIAQEAISKQIAQVTSEIKSTQEALQKNPDDAFLKQKAALLSQKYTGLKETQKLWDRLIAPLEENIAFHEQYLADPDLDGYFAELIGDKTIYTFEDLQKTFQLVEDQKKKVKSLTNEKENEEKELENRKKTAKVNLAHLEALKEKRQQNQLENYQGLTDVEQEQILDLEEQLHMIRARFNERLLQEIELKIDLTDMYLFLERQKLDIAKVSLKRIKPKVRISEATITMAREKLAKQKETSFLETATKIHPEIDTLNRKIAEKEEELKALGSKYSIALGPELDVWQTEPVKQPDGYNALCLVGRVNAQLKLLKRRKDYKQAQL